MQTFMTRETFGKTAADLDGSRLSNQINEAMGIFDHLTGVKPDFYPYHPIMGMWRGYEYALAVYAMQLNLELTFQRGQTIHTYFMTFAKAVKEIQADDPEFVYAVPPWMGDPDLLKSQRSRLVAKNPIYYVDKWKVAPVNWPYLWPRIDDRFEDGYGLYLSKTDKERLKTGERAWPGEDTLERIVNI